MPITAKPWSNEALIAAEASLKSGWEGKKQEYRDRATVQALVGLGRQMEHSTQVLADRIATSDDPMAAAIVDLAKSIRELVEFLKNDMSDDTDKKED